MVPKYQNGVSEAGQRLFREAGGIAESPFPTYSGTRLATYNRLGGGAPSKLTQREQLGLQELEQQRDIYEPYIERAKGVAADIGGQRFAPGTYAAPAGVETAAYGAAPTVQSEAFGPAIGPERAAFAGGPQFDEAAAQRYSDIFQTAVAPATREVTEAFDRRQQQLAASAGGAFGGDRYGIQSAELSRLGAQERGRIRAEAGKQGLEFGSQQVERDRAAAERAYQLGQGERFGAFDRERGARERAYELGQAERFGAFDRDVAARERGFQLGQGERFGKFDRDVGAGERAYSMQTEADRAAFDLNQASRRMQLDAEQGMAAQVQGLVQQEAQGLIAGGEAERILDQQALELAYRDYAEQREYPFTAVNFALGALKQVPYETREYSMQRGGEFIQTPSIYGQTLGGLGALASAYKLLS